MQYSIIFTWKNQITYTYIHIIYRNIYYTLEFIFIAIVILHLTRVYNISNLNLVCT